MSPLIVILLSLVGLAALQPTDRHLARAEADTGRLRERVALLRRLGLIGH